MKKLKALLMGSTSMMHLEVYAPPKHDNIHDGMVYGHVTINGVAQMQPSKIINVLVSLKTCPLLFTCLTGRPHPQFNGVFPDLSKMEQVF